MPARIKQLTTETLQHQVDDLANQLRIRRKALGVAVESAASAAGMSRDTWYRMERGETTVTIGAWFNALSVLGLRFGIGLHANGTEKVSADSIPTNIALADYPQLAALAWQMDDAVTLTPREAFAVYERNARHIDKHSLSPDEKALIVNLQRIFA